MAEATALNASQRDVLYAVAAASEGPGDATVAEVRSVAAQSSERIPEKKTGTFYKALDALEDEYQYLVTKEYAENSRTDVVALTKAGATALDQLAERSDELPEE